MIKAAIARSNKASPGQIKTIKSLNSKVTDEFLDNMTMKQASAMLTVLLATSKRKKKEDGITEEELGEGEEDFIYMYL